MMEVSPDNPEWVKTEEAAIMLGMTDNPISTLRKSEYVRTAKVVGGRGRRGWAFHDDDVMLIAEIRRQARCGVAVAVRIFDAMKEGRMPYADADRIVAEHRIMKEALGRIMAEAPKAGEDSAYLVARDALRGVR